MNEQPEERRLGMPEDPNERVGFIRGLLDQFTLTWRLLWDERINLGLKLIPFSSLLYLLIPFDDVLLAFLGPGVVIDEIGVIMLAMTIFTKAAPPDIVKEHLSSIRSGLEAGEQGYADEDDIIDVDAEPVEGSPQ